MMCRTLKDEIKRLKAQLAETNELLQQEGDGQALRRELLEIQQQLEKYNSQVDHLQTHNSTPQKLIMGFSLVVFVAWMIFVLSNNLQSDSNKS